jgi:serine/threonine protein kinase
LKKPIQFGKYYLLDRVNIGGMAEVFKAKAFGVEGFERLLAVKRILPNIAEDEEFITMFIDEAKIAVQLNHANICQIFDLGKVDDSYFIALEFVHGKDLRAIFDRCKQRPVDGSAAMPVAQACFIIMKACEGLDYAHNKRDAQGRELHLVHRDVSPQNVLISYEGEVKLIDFGIAKAAGKASKTQQGILKGKFGYMSPEQVRGLPLDRRSDIFSLGIVLYELLTGERLFVGESDFSTLEKVRNVEILPPSTYNRRIADELERIVMKALAKDVDDRYQNAIDLHDDLQAFMYTAGEFYSRKDLAAWMKRVFATEIEQESAKLESYRQMSAPTMPPTGPAAAAASPAGAKRTMAMSALPPPPPPATGGPGPLRASAQHAAASPRVSASHAVASSPKPAGIIVGAEHADLGWDDEELATNIYDAPQDATDAVVEDRPDDLGDIELNSTGEPVPHASVMSSAPSPAAAAPQRAPLPAIDTRADKPHRETATPYRDPLPPVETRTDKPRGINGATPKANPFDFVLPEAPRAPFESPVVAAAPRPARRSRAPLYIGLAVGGAVVCASVVGLISFMGRPGEVVITSEPAANVKILVDARPQPIEGTPATIKLEPGPHVITVQREGFVPQSETIDVNAGDHLKRRFALEPLAFGSFTLVSEPAGAQAILDGNTLGGVTPIKVESVLPGKHHLEVKGSAGTWAEDVVIEAGKLAELRATLAPAAQAAAAPTAVAAVTPRPAPAPPPRPVAAPRPAPVAAPRPTPAAAPSPAPRPAPVAAIDREPPPRRLPRPPKEPRVTAKKPAPEEDTPPQPAPPPAKPAAAAATEKPAGAGEGYLRLGSKPWTNISVDGKDTGLHTPQTHLKLPAGTHKVTLTNPQFSIKETFSVEIRGGETETVIKDLRPQGAETDAD